MRQPARLLYLNTMLSPIITFNDYKFVYLPDSASVMVHVIKDEHPAAMQHSNTAAPSVLPSAKLKLVCLIIGLLLLMMQLTAGVTMAAVQRGVSMTQIDSHSGRSHQEFHQSR